MPTVSAVNGHAFGAGFMIALCHDVRLMREDGRALCAPTARTDRYGHPTSGTRVVQTPGLSASAFFETTQLAKRWTGPVALAAGVAQETAPLEREIRGRAIEKKAAALARVLAQIEHCSIQNKAFTAKTPLRHQRATRAAFMLRNSHLYERFGS